MFFLRFDKDIYKYIKANIEISNSLNHEYLNEQTLGLSISFFIFKKSFLNLKGCDNIFEMIIEENK